MNEEFWKSLNKALATVAIFIALAIAGVTAVVFVRNRGHVEPTYRRVQPAPQNGSHAKGQDDAYTAVGQIRVFSKRTEGEESSPLVVVTPWFSYPQGDTALFEELSQKEKQIQSVVTRYFAEMTLNEVRRKGERQVKEDLLQLVNANLVMGKVHAVYFDNYVFIE